jgi:hypothetical protein
MRKHWLTLGVAAAVALLATSAFAANRGVSFTPIGFIEDPGQWPASAIYSMNPSGTVFMATPSVYGNYCVKWTKDGGWGEHVGSAGSVCFLADDGSIAADGYEPYGYDYPGYWLGTVDAWDPIPLPDNAGEGCPGAPISMHGASDNLEYLVGLGWEECKGRRFMYEKSSDTTVQLDCMDEKSCRLNDVTNDGSKAVGWNTALCGAWRGTKTVGDDYDWIDGLGTLQRKYCTSGSPCCGNNDCPEFVDAFCDEQCIDGFCGPGPNEGMACTSNWQCDGYCVNGPNHGQECTSSYYCPDVTVCLDNPDWDEMVMEDYKGEGYKVTPDGQYTLGFEYGQSPYNWDDPLYDWTLFSSAYVENPDGSFTQVSPPPGGLQGDSWTPLAISDSGDVVVGRYGWWIYSYPTLWTKYTGTLDFQYFLVSQGLDELWFWTLSSLNAVSADGRTVAGYGNNTTNPDCPSAWGCQEGFVVDLAKVKVCHMPGNHNERTLTIALESAGDHLGHGDFLGTCEFMNSGGRSRAGELHPQRPAELSGETPIDYDPVIPTRQDAAQRSQLGSPALDSEQPQQAEPTREHRRNRAVRSR